MKRKPNIIYFLVDQWRQDAVGCYGKTPCKTPHIDAIASEGTRFENAYTTCALCSPARASIMTGLMPHMHGQLSNTGNFNGAFDRNVVHCDSYARHLQKAGYYTGYAGKFHLPGEGDTELWGYDQWRKQEEHGRWLESEGITFDFGISEVQPLEWGGDAVFCGASALDAEHHHDHWVADQLIDMIQTQDGSKPFMFCAGFHGPHFPYAVPKPYDTLYDPDSVPRPINFDETFDHKPLVQQKEISRWNTAHLTINDWKRITATYWGYCTYIDEQIGRVIAALKDANVYDNTMILFTSDHGDMLGSHRMFNKGFNMYEEDYLIPCILRVPGGKQQATYDGYVSLVDVMPTFLDAAGVAQQVNTDGTSLLKFLNEGEVQARKLILAEFNGYESTLLTMRMIRNKQWKYIYNPFDIDELYDEESDPGELRNVAALPAFEHVLRRMRQLMFETLQSAGDSIVDLTLWQSNSYGLTISPREA